MQIKNSVFIATSIDGYIADKNGSLDWLQAIPNPQNIDMGYTNFISNTDAIIMGRKTFETVCSFDIEWPYELPVFVLSNTLQKIEQQLKSKVELVNGSLKKLLKELNQKSYKRLYIDGGGTIQNFLKEDLIDEMIITTMPILLGGGTKLFEELPEHINFELIESKVFLKQIVQNHYQRKK